jgi:hypothetical protein
VLYWNISQISENNTERYEKIVRKTARLNEMVWQHESRIWAHGSKILSVLQEYGRIDTGSCKHYS